MTTKELFNTFTREDGIKLFNSKMTNEEVYKLAVSKGLTDSYEEFLSEARKIILEKYSSMDKGELMEQLEGAELTEEQLALVAGGGSCGCTGQGLDKEDSELLGKEFAVVGGICAGALIVGWVASAFI